MFLDLALEKLCLTTRVGWVGYEERLEKVME